MNGEDSQPRWLNLNACDFFYTVDETMHGMCSSAIILVRSNNKLELM